jgi:hypothetical protein
MRLTSNRLFLYVAAIVVMAFAVFDASAGAQSLRLKVEIPFVFQAGEKALPAGTYLVERRGDAIHIFDGNGHGSFVLAHAVANQAVRGGDTLIFNRYGETHFLSEVRWSEYANARRLVTSPEERKLASAPERVIRAATAR